MINLRLVDLDPQFFRYEERDGHAYHVHVDTIGEAHGIGFLCPKCFAENNGPVGTHTVVCWSRSAGTPDDALPGPGRWKLVGTSYEDLSLNVDPPSKARSVMLNGGCAWHGFITNGQAT